MRYANEDHGSDDQFRLDCDDDEPYVSCCLCLWIDSEHIDQLVTWPAGSFSFPSSRICWRESRWGWHAQWQSGIGDRAFDPFLRRLGAFGVSSFMSCFCYQQVPSIEVAVFKHLVGSCLDCSGTVVVFFGISVYLLISYSRICLALHGILRREERLLKQYTCFSVV